MFQRQQQFLYRSLPRHGRLRIFWRTTGIDATNTKRFSYPPSQSITSLQNSHQTSAESLLTCIANPDSDHQQGSVLREFISPPTHNPLQTCHPFSSIAHLKRKATTRDNHRSNHSTQTCQTQTPTHPRLSLP